MTGTFRSIVFLSLFTAVFSTLMFFCPGRAPALYQWTDEDGQVHFTDYPPTSTQDVRVIDEPSGQPREETDAAAVTGVSVVDDVLRSLRAGRVEEITRTFRFFEDIRKPEEIALQKERIVLLPKMVFERFGRPGPFEWKKPAKNYRHLSIVYSAYASQWKTADCRFLFYDLTTRLGQRRIPAVFRISTCTEGDRTWLKDLAVGLDDSGGTLAGDVRRFRADYKKALANIRVPAGTRPATGSFVRDTSRPVTREGRVAQDRPKTVPAKPIPREDADAAKKTEPRRTEQPVTPAMAPAVTPVPTGITIPSGPGMDSFINDLLGPVVFWVGVIGGTVLGLIVGVILFFYLLWSLSLYLICRKREVGGAWLAWLPVIKVFPMTRAGGRPWWWAVLIALPWLAPATGDLTVVAALAGILVLVSVVLFVIVWFGISDRFGLNKWLGLLLIVPVAQIVYPCYLAFRTEPDGAGVRRLRPAFLTVVVLLVATAAAAAFVPAVLQRTVGTLSSSAFTLTPSPADTTERPEILREGAPIAVVSVEEYDRALRNAAVASGAEGFTPAGPAALRLDEFWESPDDPHVWIKTRLAPLPNMGTELLVVRVHIENVTATDGRDVYARDHNLETEFFEKVHAGAPRPGQDYVESIRDVHLVPGTVETDVAGVEGAILVEFPRGVKRLTFNRTEIGGEQHAHGLSVVVSAVGPSEVVLELKGELDRYVLTRAFNAEGAELASTGGGSFGTDKQKSMSRAFAGKIETFEVLVAEGRQERRFPFTLGR